MSEGKIVKRRKRCKVCDGLAWELDDGVCQECIERAEMSGGLACDLNDVLVESCDVDGDFTMPTSTAIDMGADFATQDMSQLPLFFQTSFGLINASMIECITHNQIRIAGWKSMQLPPGAIAEIKKHLWIVELPND